MLKDINVECIKTIRSLAIDIVDNAKSGHIGMPLGMAPFAHILFSKYLRFSPKQPSWPNRDRFILSNGHGSALQYILLHLCGYNISMDDLKQFRTINSKTQGHPERCEHRGIEVTTGPLGQGVANGVGMAIAEKHIAAKFNRDGFDIFNHKIYVFCGDGDLQEGISSEASSLAGTLNLNNLILIYDNNEVTIDGPTELTFTENVLLRYKAYNWNVLEVNDGNDLTKIDEVLKKATISNKPTLISLKTIIGFGMPDAGRNIAHGPFTDQQKIIQTKKNLNINPNQKFEVPDIVKQFYKKLSANNHHENWSDILKKYTEKYNDKAEEIKRIFLEKKLPEDWDQNIIKFVESKIEKEGKQFTSTRSSSYEILTKIAENIPEVIGGSADLAFSSKVYLKGNSVFNKSNYGGRYIHFGVREFAMFGICNGISTYGLIPYSSTFLVFLSYGFPAVRIGAMSKLRSLFIMSHDSIGVGQDGPTHQPIEVLPLLRSTPNLNTFRPCDINEVAAAYIYAIKNSTGPSVITLSRQKFQEVDNTSIKDALNGAYIINKNSDPKKKLDFIFIASGSEVPLAVDSAKRLMTEFNLTSNVISAPCLELFSKSPLKYRRKILPHNIPIISIEASSIFGWAGYAHFCIGIDVYGDSGSADDVMEKHGFSINSVVERTIRFLGELKRDIDFNIGRLIIH